jgi:hypothetical protein
MFPTLKWSMASLHERLKHIVSRRVIVFLFVGVCNTAFGYAVFTCL